MQARTRATTPSPIKIRATSAHTATLLPISPMIAPIPRSVTTHAMLDQKAISPDADAGRFTLAETATTWNPSMNPLWNSQAAASMVQIATPATNGTSGSVRRIAIAMAPARSTMDGKTWSRKIRRRLLCWTASTTYPLTLALISIIIGKRIDMVAAVVGDMSSESTKNTAVQVQTTSRGTANTEYDNVIATNLASVISCRTPSRCPPCGVAFDRFRSLRRSIVSWDG